MKCEPDDDDPFSFEGPEIISTSGYLFIYLFIVVSYFWRFTLFLQHLKVETYPLQLVFEDDVINNLN